jgi:hypothetical protein
MARFRVLIDGHCGDSIDLGKTSQLVTAGRERQKSAYTNPLLLLFPLALGAGLMATNRWFTEVDDECAIIDLAAPPVSRTLRIFWNGLGLHEHPPLYDLLLHGWLRFTGGNIHLLRLPSVIFYVLAAWIIGITARRLGGERSQLWALVIVALWPFGFHFGRLATWYSFCFLLVSLLTLAYFRFLEEPSPKNWFRFLAASIALVYSNYFGWAILFCLALDYVIRNRRQLAAAGPRVLLGAAILVAAYLPLFRSFHRETELGIHPGAFSISTLVNIAYNTYCVFERVGGSVVLVSGRPGMHRGRDLPGLDVSANSSCGESLSRIFPGTRHSSRYAERRGAEARSARKPLADFAGGPGARRAIGPGRTPCSGWDARAGRGDWLVRDFLAAVVCGSALG